MPKLSAEVKFKFIKKKIFLAIIKNERIVKELSIYLLLTNKSGLPLRI